MKIQRCNQLLLIFFLLISFLVLIFTFASAVPYKSYTYNLWGEVVPAPQAYVPIRTINGKDLGISNLDKPQDLYVSDEQIYLLDSGNNRVLIFNYNWELTNIIKDFYNNGILDTFKNPSGIFVLNNENIFIADTENGRIVELDKKGDFIREIGTPKITEKGTFSDAFSYRPLKVVVDFAGRLYVIAQDIYDGLIKMDKDGDFLGFIGAPRVTPNPLDYLWRRFATEEQRSRMGIFLPTEFNNFDIDNKGFIYVIRKGTAINDSIKMLNPQGIDLLTRGGFFPPRGDIVGGSVFRDIKIKKSGVYSVLDQLRGRVFTYNANGHLLYVFGGLGNQKGLFINPVALDTLGSDIIVLDASKNSITVFEKTEYSLLIHKAINTYNVGNYEKSATLWREVLKQNVNYDLAYTGVGRSLLRQNDYKGAMDYFRLGYNRKSYSNAYGLYRREIINDYFNKIVFGIIFLLLLLILFKRYNRKLVKNSSRKTELLLRIKSLYKKITYSLYIIFHPFDGFWDLKHEKRGNMFSSTLILIFLIITYVFAKQYTGFVFNLRDLSELNLFVEIVSVLIPFILWCTVNWALTTIMTGKGTLKDIYVYSSYALVPIIIINIPLTIISNYMTINEGAFYYLLLSLAVLWALVLLFFGTIVIHDYSLPKTLFVSILIIVGMGVVLFMTLLFFTLLAQVSGFITAIYSEIMFRL